MKRILSSLLIVCAFAQPVVPVLAQQSAGITITSMDRGSVRPFDRLVISGTGFLPATAAISVSFVPKQHGVPIVIPVFRATATQVEVIVPAFLDPSAGDFGFGQADVQVVQVTADQVMSSNVLTGLDVAPVPVLPESVGTGKVTRAFMQLSLEFLTASNGAAVAAFKSEQAAVLAQVDAVVANPGVEVPLKTIDASPFLLSGAMLKASDRLIAAYLTSIEPFVRAQRLGGDRAHATAEPCILNTGSAFWDDSLCSLRVAVFGGGPNWRGGVATIAAGAMVMGLAALTPPIAIGVGAIGVVVGAGVALTGAAQLVYLAAASTLGQSIVGPDAPPLMYSLRYHGRKMFENANENVGVPILTAAIRAADAIAEQAAIVRDIADPSPRGGTITGASGISADGLTQNMNVYQGIADAILAIPVKVMLTKSTRTVFESRIEPPDISWFDGAYLGVMNLTATGGGKQESGTIDMSFTVLGGVVKMIDPAGGSGSVSANGRLKSSVGVCTVSGTLEVTAPGLHGPGSGGGALPLCVNGEYTGWGTWQVSRAPRP